MSNLSSARLSDLPVEILYHIALNLPPSSLFALLRASRFFYDVFCDEIYRLASVSQKSHIYLYRCATLAVRKNNTDIALRRFIDNCADKAVLSVSTYDFDFPYGSALQMMASFGNEAIVRLLVDNGANVNVIGGIHGSALQAAVSNGHEAVARLLLDRGADINFQNYEGTALHAAASGGHEAVVRLLLDHGPDINAQNHRGTALHAAASNGRETAVRLLLDHGADINAQDQNGTALHAAARKGRKAVTRLLLRRGADDAIECGDRDEP